MLLICKRTQICLTPPRFPKSVLHLPCSSPISSPGLEEFKKSEWFPELPLCSDKTITVLTAAHPHESWPEQPGTALYCKKQSLINHPGKNNLLLCLSPACPSFSCCTEPQQNKLEEISDLNPSTSVAGRGGEGITVTLKLTVLISVLCRTPGSTI